MFVLVEVGETDDRCGLRVIVKDEVHRLWAAERQPGRVVRKDFAACGPRSALIDHSIPR